MNTTLMYIVGLMLLAQMHCQSQESNKMSDNNPLLCDPKVGFCATPGAKELDAQTNAQVQSNKPITVIYYTDPICSSCWGIEPQLRKLKLEYGSVIQFEYRMGGLLPDWSYNSGGISKPSDVAHHWDEVSAYYDMPIDGDVWLEDPLDSSYPPSIAFKAAQLQSEEKAILFLRAIREMVFLEKKNITKWDNLAEAASKVGLDVARMKEDYENKAIELFEEDLKLGRELGIRGFPTMIFTDASGKREVVYGSKPYSAFEGAIQKLAPKEKKTDYSRNWHDLFDIYQTMTAKEYSELSGIPRNKVEDQLEKLIIDRKLEKFTIKSGSIYRLREEK